MDAQTDASRQAWTTMSQPGQRRMALGGLLPCLRIDNNAYKRCNFYSSIFRELLTRERRPSQTDTRRLLARSENAVILGITYTSKSLGSPKQSDTHCTVASTGGVRSNVCTAFCRMIWQTSSRKLTITSIVRLSGRSWAVQMTRRMITIDCVERM